MGIKDYSTTASDNTSLFPEGMNPGSVNNSARQVQADIREFYENPEWRDYGNTPTYVSATSFTIPSNVTTRYAVGCRIRMYGTTMGTLYGTIANSTYSAPNTTITVTMDSGSLTSNLSAVSLGVSPTGFPVPQGSVKLDGTLITGQSNITPATDDNLLVSDTSDSGNLKKTQLSAVFTLYKSSVVLPTRQILTSGTTYTTPAGALKIRVRMWGGGGGGAASGTSTAAAAGGDTSFNSITAKGGAAGVRTGASADAGNGTGTASLRLKGALGQSSSTVEATGGFGGGTSLCGPTAGAQQNNAGNSANANTGCGGQGGAAGGSAYGGGQAGEYAEFEITNPSASYTYAIGAGGAGGTGGSAGGAGGSGLIVVEEFY